jgi:hypothetical protein
MIDETEKSLKGTRFALRFLDAFVGNKYREQLIVRICFAFLVISRCGESLSFAQL